MGRSTRIATTLLAAVAAVGAVSLSGCEAEWSLRGHVVGSGVTRSDDAAFDGKVPLAYARIVLLCAGEPDRGVQADRDGAFELAGSGPGPRLDCLVEATAPGRAAWRAPVDAVCADDGEGDGRCANGAMVAELAPAGAETRPAE